MTTDALASSASAYRAAWHPHIRLHRYDSLGRSFYEVVWRFGDNPQVYPPTVVPYAWRREQTAAVHAFICRMNAGRP